MKKFLLMMMLCVMSVCGAWAQEASIEQLISEEGNLITTTESSPLVLDVNNTSGVKIYVKATGPGGFWVEATSNSNVSSSSFNWAGQYGTNGYFTITPQNAGNSKVTVNVMVYEYPGGVQTPVSKASVDLWVKVEDATLATSLVAPSDPVTVAHGYSTTVPFTYTPSTAVFTCSEVAGGSDNITYSFVNNVLTVTASAEATAGDTKSFTITPKDGSEAEAITIPVTVVDPVALKGISFPFTEHTIKKNKTISIFVRFDPVDAANKTVNWNINESNNDVISFNKDSGIVTAKNRGNATLTATSEEGGHTASVNFKVTEPFEGELVVPSSIRVGTTGLKVTFNSTNGATAEDYTITYQTTKSSCVNIDEEGNLTPIKKGQDKISATLTPTQIGEEKGFTEAKFSSTTFDVGDEISGEWSGSIENQTMDLAEIKTIDTGYPEISWSSSEAGAETYYYVESEDETIIKGSYTGSYSGSTFTPSGVQLIAYGTGSTTVRVKAVYGIPTWIDGPGWVVNSPLAVKYSDPINVTVNGVSGSLTLSPSEDVTMDIADSDATKTITASWPSGDNIGWEQKSESSKPEVATATISGDQLTIHPVGAGVTTVTVTSTWTKKVYNPVGFEASQEITKTFTVTVNDKTAATSLSVAPTANVAKGYLTVLDVTFEPETANGFTCSVTGNSGVSAALSADFKKLTISATAEASTSDHATVTITPKAGSTAPAATVDVTVVDPVGINTITLAADKENPLVGEKVTLTPTFDPEEPASKHLAWTSSSDDIATVDENGIVTAKARGTVTITATSDNINNEGVKTATATITVKEELAPAADVRPKSTLRLGEIYNSELSLTDASMGTFSYISDATDIISVTSDGTLTANKVGTANITVTINPTADGTAANYVAWTRTMPITVIPAEFGLTLAAEPIKVSSAAGGTIIVTPNVTLNDVATDNTAYTIAYTLENASGDITINAATGEVTIPASTPVQQFAVVATLTPNDTENYKGAVGKAAVLVEGTASAGINLSRSTITVKDAYGNDVLEELVIVNVPTPGAFGSRDEETITSTIDETTLQMLKDAKNVKVTGLLANSDVQKLVLTIGTGGNPKYTSKCEYIDMGEATMTEAITTDGKKCSLVGDTYYALESAKTVVLPRPAIGVTNGTVLPANTNKLYTNVDGNSQTALTTLVIPEGWTELADCFSSYNKGASYNGTVGVGNSACLTLTSLTLPNSLEKIGAYAFSSLQVKTLYMPTNLQRIAKYAFDPCTKLQDVYFTGPAPKYVDTFAFGGETQMCNNTVDDNQLQGEYDPVITRHEYHKLDVYACILHYPSEYEEDYIDTSRKYTVIPADMPYSKGNSTAKNTYYLPGWSDAKIAEVNEKRLGAMTLATYEQDFGVKDKTYGHSFIWPSQSQMATGYLIARAGYQWSGDPLRTADQYDPSATYENGGVDKRGLYQFIVGMGNAPKDQKKWVFPTQYEKGKWYTFSVPFDMSVEQIQKVFGPGTQVCRLSKVVRDTNVSPNILKIEFRYSVMEEPDSRPKKTTYVESELDASGNTITNTYTQSGIRHHWPYMIKPGGSVDEIKENDATFYEDGSRVLPDYEAVTGILRIETVTAVDTEDRTTGKEYMFSPILMKGKIKKNSYVLSRNKNTGAHEFIFYKGVNTGNVDENGKPIYEDGGTASANTAYVQLMHGQADFDTYFPTATINQSKVSFASIFGDFVSEEDILSDIEKIEIVCGNDNVNAGNDKIYTINGVLVNGKSLAPGLYIKNGKKFIVK